MNVEEISKLIEVFAKSGLQEFTYEEEGMKLSLQGKQNTVAVSAAPAAAPETAVQTAALAPVPAEQPAAPAVEKKEGMIHYLPAGGRILRKLLLRTRLLMYPWATR